jgi:hypothetical protein
VLIVDTVFELVSGEDRARMEAAKMQGDIAKKQLEKTAPSNEKDAPCHASLPGDARAPASLSAQLIGSAQSNAVGVKLDRSPTTQPLTTQQPLWKPSGFMPFAKNPEKQKRYEVYLEAVKQGKKCKLYLDCCLRIGEHVVIVALSSQSADQGNSAVVSSRSCLVNGSSAVNMQRRLS